MRCFLSNFIYLFLKFEKQFIIIQNHPPHAPSLLFISFPHFICDFPKRKKIKTVVKLHTCSVELEHQPLQPLTSLQHHFKWDFFIFFFALAEWHLNYLAKISSNSSCGRQKTRSPEIKLRSCKFLCYALTLSVEMKNLERSRIPDGGSEGERILIKIFDSAPKNLKASRKQNLFNIAFHQQHIENTSSIHCVKIKTLFHSLVSLSSLFSPFCWASTSISNCGDCACSHIRIMPQMLNVFIERYENIIFQQTQRKKQSETSIIDLRERERERSTNTSAREAGGDKNAPSRTR